MDAQVWCGEAFASVWLVCVVYQRYNISLIVGTTPTSDYSKSVIKLKVIFLDIYASLINLSLAILFLINR